jgi:aspartate racemase
MFPSRHERGCSTGETNPGEESMRAPRSYSLARTRGWQLGKPANLVGILGGMGPLATADLYRKIIEITPASRDQDHIPVVIWSDPRVPDRASALLASGASPLPWLIRGAQALQSMGASIIAIPCNTAHAFLSQLQAEVGGHFIDMIEATVHCVAAKANPSCVVGLLGSTATLQLGLYQHRFAKEGVRVVVPSETEQSSVMEAIARLKAGDLSEPVCQMALRAAQGLIERGSDVVIAGCTELPLAFARLEPKCVPVIDPTRVLAEALVRATRP